MGRRSARRNRHRPQSQAVVKAQQPMAGTVAVPVAAVLQALVGQQQAGVAEPLPRQQEWAAVPFGPGLPLVPQPINPTRLDSGRAEPRRYEYPVSVNLPGTNQRLLPWKVLRDAADGVDVMRRCIEVRKAEVLGLGWDITVSKQAVADARRDDPTASDSDIAQALRDAHVQHIDRARQWWEMPDRTNGFGFDDWLMQVMEENLVLDALAIYPRLTVGGDLWALEVLDGSTIKPLLDDRGNTPAPPNPAYQQVLMGFPRGEFVADAILDPHTGDAIIDNAYRTDQLVYAKRNVRTWTPYGYSPVEQALVSADLWMKRQAWMRAEYTDGVMPSGWMETDTNMTPEQLRAYQAVMNDELAGMTQERHRIRLLPKGFKPTEMPDAAERYRPDYDEFLVKLVCSHFGVLPSRLGFTPHGGLGGKGHQEGEEDSEERLSTRPTTEWLAGLFTRLSRQFLGMPRTLEFRFLGLDSEDEAAADETAEKRVRSGRMTLNEDRDRIGMPRFDFPEADMPMVMSQSGVVFLEGRLASQAGEQTKPGDPLGGDPATGTDPEGARVPAGSSPEATKPAAGTQGPPGAKTGPDGAAGAGKDQAKTEELAALRRYAKRRAGMPARTFVCKHLTAADLDAAVMEGRIGPNEHRAAVAKADGGDASREAPGRVDRPARAGHGSPHGRRDLGFAWADPEPGPHR